MPRPWASESSAPTRRLWLPLAGAVAIALLAWVLGQSAFSGGNGRPDPASLPTVAASALPQQARDTLTLIDRGGPFPYDRDGVVFENREGQLPDERYGYYHEYTVPTPGEADRGPLRIVTGAPGEYYWTHDHYVTFERITR